MTRTRTVDVEFTSGASVDIEYVLEMGSMTTPPGMPIAYYWQVADNQGNRAHTEETMVRFDDTRFDWQMREDGRIAVWWHDKPASFGEKVFVIARQSVQRQYALFKVDIDNQIRIVVYNTEDEFHAWHGSVDEWAAGRAFPFYGITAQIVTEDAPEDRWLTDVVPHEISHLYFDQLIGDYDILDEILWLNEGVAQYNEFVDHSDVLGRAYDGAYLGELVRLENLNQLFRSFDDERVFLAYAQSYSVVKFIVDEYGEEGLADLLIAYRDGSHTDEAFMAALGISFEDFERDWGDWIGVNDQFFATPTPFPLPTSRPSPTPFVIEDNITDKATPTPTALAESEDEIAGTRQVNSASTSLVGASILMLVVVSVLGLRLGKR